MSQITASGCWFRLAVSTAVAFAFLIGLGRPLQATLVVSDLGGQIRLFDNNGNPIKTMTGGAEGVACVVGGVPALFVADNSAVISVYDPTSLTLLGGGVTIVGGSQVAALSLSPDGLTLYAADYGAGKIFALSTTAILAATTGTRTITPLFVASTGASHDVAVDPSGNVYTAHFQTSLGVLKFDQSLLPLGSFISPAAATGVGLTHPSGMLFALGSFWVSNFSGNACSGATSLNCGAIFEFDLSGNLLHKISAPTGSNPIGLALGPGDGNIYVALLGMDSIGKIDLSNRANPTLSTFIATPNAGHQPKYLQFTENCTTPTNAFIEVCKSSSITNPVTGNFTFTATNGTFTSAPIVVPVGYCSGPIPVPEGTVTVTETPATGAGVSAIKAFGYGPASIEGNLLLKSDLTKGTAMVKVIPGDSSTETVVDFTNYETPTGILEVCKDAAPGGPPVMGGFLFTVSGAPNNPYVLPAGACSGPILVQAGSVTITEMPRTGFQLVDVDTIPLGRLVSTNIPGGSAVVTVAAGGVSTETVARFINGTVSPDTGQLKICKIAGPGISPGQTFTISANGVPYTVPAGPASQGGFCVFDGTFPVGTVVTVQEQIPPGPPPPYQVLNIAVNPPDRSSGTPDLLNGKMSVIIGPGFTEVTFTNIGSTPMGQLKICKIAGPGIAIGTNFTFTATGQGSTQTFTVPAGPASEGGYCVVDGAFPLGTQVTVMEAVPAGASVKGITVSPASRGGTPSGNSVVATIGTGFTEVTFTNMVPAVAPTGSCQASSSLSVLVRGTSVVGYVPQGNWRTSVPGIGVVNVEGTSVTAPMIIPTGSDTINSCASNPLSGQTVCTANNSKVYVLKFSALPGLSDVTNILTSNGTLTISFSGGFCTNCGVAMDAVHNRAVIGLSFGSKPAFQFLDLVPLVPLFGTPFISPSGSITEDPVIDPFRNLILSAAENNNYEIVDVTNSTSPKFFENAISGLSGALDSSAEDCTTGIALAPAEESRPSQVYIADLTQATFLPGSPAGTWTAVGASQVQTLTGSVFSASGASGLAVAQGTHIGIVADEFGGDAITAIALPTTSGSGIPAISAWLTCHIGGGFSIGFDPHTVTAYQSPNGGKNAMAVLANGGANLLAVVDLTAMLALPETAPGSHVCASGTLPAAVARFVSVP